MGFFETFWRWLDTQLATYVGDNAALVARALEPAAFTLVTLYVMVWGFLQLTGRIDEPFVFGLRRILTVAIVLGAALRLWLYNTVIVDTFQNAPVELAAAVIGAADPVQVLDSIWERGGAVAGQLWKDGGFFNDGLGFFIAGLLVWILIGLLCVYTLFLMALSHVALSILLALGPLFIVMVPFDLTRRFFDAWLAQLANYALITVLTVMAASLLLQIVNSYAMQTAALGAALQSVDVLNMLLVALLVFLFMRQIMPIAAGLAGGSPINTFGTVSGAIQWSRGAGSRWVGRGIRAAAAIIPRRSER
jgi:type IV secretion system protein VirB6